VRDAIKRAEGSIQPLPMLPDELKAIYRTVWELPMRALIDMAAERGAFIDQSQSLNLFSENPNIGQLSSMYMYAWKRGLKTTYYLRSRPATRIAKTTLGADDVATKIAEADAGSKSGSDLAAVACSLENPGTCEACQ
jgi:ribonucleoside-diphosphate reductase alpha chain